MSESKTPPQTPEEMASWFIQEEIQFEWLPKEREFKIIERTPAVRKMYFWDVNTTGRMFYDRSDGEGGYITHYGPF